MNVALGTGAGILCVVSSAQCNANRVGLRNETQHFFECHERSTLGFALLNPTLY